MSVVVLPGTGADIEEPDWDALIPLKKNAPQRAIARREWMRVTAAMRAVETLAPENRHQLQRLVLAYVRYDIAAAKVFSAAAIIKSSRTKVPMMNLWQVELRQADDDATKAEQELGIPPRRRGSVTKTKRKEKARLAADRYLK